MTLNYLPEKILIGIQRDSVCALWAGNRLCSDCSR